MSQPLENENLSENSPDGALFGRTSTKKIALYGNTPVVRTASTSTNDVSTTTTVSLSTAGVAAAMWGFATQTEIANFVTAVSTMQLTMKQLGIIAS